MQNPSHNLLPQSSQMALLRNTLHRNLIYLTRTKLISTPPSTRTHRPFHSSNRLRNDESPSSSDANQSKAWAVYDPVSDSFVTTTFEDGDPTSGGETLNAKESAPKRFISASGSRAVKSVPARAAGGMGYAMKKKAGKTRVHWVCGDCGESFLQWWGTCQSCDAVGTLKKFAKSERIGNNARGFEISENAIRSWLPQREAELRPRRLRDVNKGINPLEWRIPL